MRKEREGKNHQMYIIILGRAAIGWIWVYSARKLEKSTALLSFNLFFKDHNTKERVVWKGKEREVTEKVYG